MMLSHFLQNTKERGAIHDSPTLIYALTGIAHTCKETSFYVLLFVTNLYISRARIRVQKLMYSDISDTLKREKMAGLLPALICECFQCSADTGMPQMP